MTGKTDFFSFYGSFFNSQSRDQNKQYEQVLFLGQAVSLSEELVPLEDFLQTTFHFIRVIYSNPLIFPDTLTEDVSPLDYIVPELQKAKLYGTSRNVELDPLHALLLPIFKGSPGINSRIANKHATAIARVVHRDKVCDKYFHLF